MAGMAVFVSIFRKETNFKYCTANVDILVCFKCFLYNVL